MKEKTVKCPICGKPYKFDMTPNLSKDQSACPKCVAEANKNKTNWKNKIVEK